MGIDNLAVVDVIGVQGDYVVLTVSDAADWEDMPLHLFSLQEKINAYLQFVESGQIVEDYPLSVGKSVIVEVLFLYDYPEQAIPFLERFEGMLEQFGYGFRYRVLAEGEGCD
jgi:hypothetical protein